MFQKKKRKILIRKGDNTMLVSLQQQITITLKVTTILYGQLLLERTTPKRTKVINIQFFSSDEMDKISI